MEGLVSGRGGTTSDMMRPQRSMWMQMNSRDKARKRGDDCKWGWFIVKHFDGLNTLSEAGFSFSGESYAVELSKKRANFLENVNDAKSATLIMP